MPTNKLEKAELRWETKASHKKGKITCQFNPAELSFTKQAAWNVAGEEAEDGEGGASNPNLNAPKMAFGGGKPATYSLNLVFDANSDPQVADVRVYTDQLLSLTMRGAGDANSTKANDDPPIVTFSWGKLLLFKAVVTSVKITYKLFTADGAPIRATADVDFTQCDPAEDVTPAQNPTSRTDPRQTYIVYAGQRLDQIAYETYADARYWRVLAEANHLDNPFELTDGQILVIPPLD